MTYRRYALSTGRFETWQRRAFTLSVDRTLGRWSATVCQWTPRAHQLVDVEYCFFRSRSRAVDVGQRMLARAVRGGGLTLARMS